jgi:catechol 2,3-dioxygenase
LIRGQVRKNVVKKGIGCVERDKDRSRNPSAMSEWESDSADGALPATPGSYGRPPRDYRLPEGIRLGPVRLQIADLSRSIVFYEATLGLRVLLRDDSHAVLGAHENDTALVILNECPAARAAPPRRRLGLFHFAILLPDRPSLGRFVRHLAEIGAAAGAADHLVSESLYLQDPDNLGIEVYADRPRSTWRRVGHQLIMATDPLDVPGLESAAGAVAWTGTPPGTKIGHVHLHVGDLAIASDFFGQALGFDVTVWDYPGALFFAARGYHHHLGANVWAGRGAQPPTEQDAQLLEWTVELPDPASLGPLADSLARTGWPVEPLDQADSQPALLTRDPWGTRLRVSVAQAASQGH